MKYIVVVFLLVGVVFVYKMKPATQVGVGVGVGVKSESTNNRKTTEQKESSVLQNKIKENCILQNNVATTELTALGVAEMARQKNETIEKIGGQNSELRKENSDLRPRSIPVPVTLKNVAVNSAPSQETKTTAGLKRSSKWIEDRRGKICDHCGLLFPFHRAGDSACYWINQRVPTELSKCTECGLGHPLHKDRCVTGQREFGTVMPQTQIQEQPREVQQQPQKIVYREVNEQPQVVIVRQPIPIVMQKPVILYPPPQVYYQRYDNIRASFRFGFGANQNSHHHHRR